MAGGIVLSIGNLSTQYAWAFVGLSVTEVITSSITVVIGTCFIMYLYMLCSCCCLFLCMMICLRFYMFPCFDHLGTTLNYFLDDKINKAEILFPGVACFLIAVCFGSAVHSSNAADNKAKLTDYSNDSKDGTMYMFTFHKYGFKSHMIDSSLFIHCVRTFLRVSL